MELTVNSVSCTVQSPSLTSLLTVLREELDITSPIKGFGQDTRILSGVLTNMAMSNTARTGADLGYYVVFPEDAAGSFDGEWYRVAVDYALQNVSTVTDTDTVLAALS